jgi:hypothetical protein
VTLSSRVSCHVRRKGLPPRHAVEVEGLEGLGTPVQRRDRAAALAERGEVEGVPPLEVEEEDVVVGRRPGAALVNGGVELVKWGVGARRRDRTRGGVRVAEALDGQRILRPRWPTHPPAATRRPPRAPRRAEETAWGRRRVSSNSGGGAAATIRIDK